MGLGVEATTGLTSNRNVVAGILPEPFYLGQIGLKIPQHDGREWHRTLHGAIEERKFDFKSLVWLYHRANIPQVSFLPRKRSKVRCPLLGQQLILGNHTLGGYDSSRFVQTTASFPLVSNDSESLIVSIQSIATLKTLATNITLLNSEIVALIDTALPYLWLPLQACRQFESPFGHSWDPSTDMYPRQRHHSPAAAESKPIPHFHPRQLFR